jgi:hypothetical protein
MSSEMPLLINLSELNEEQLLEILEKNAKIAEHVEIIVNTDEITDTIILWDEDDGMLLHSKESIISWVAAIGSKLSKLSHVSINANPCSQKDFLRESDSAYFPVAALGELFQHCIDSLVLVRINGRMNVIGSQHEYQMVTSHLSRMTRLKTMALDGKGYSEWYATKIFKNKRRKWLEEVRDITVSPLWVINELLFALTSIETLREVTLPSNMTVESALECLTTLGNDQHSIKSLKMHVRCAKKNEPTEVQKMTAMYAKAVAKITNLKSLTLEWHDVGYRCYGLPVIAAMLSGLRQNKFLTSFVVLPLLLAPDDSSEPVRLLRNEMTQLLAGNATLTKLSIPFPKSGYDHSDEDMTKRLKFRKIDRFWLKMNRIGRKELLENLGDSKRWKATLVEQKDDLSVVFYLLSSNVSVFLSSLLPAKPSPQKKQKLFHS